MKISNIKNITLFALGAQYGIADRRKREYKSTIGKLPSSIANKLRIMKKAAS
jgi:hypothetical protein